MSGFRLKARVWLFGALCCVVLLSLNLALGREREVAGAITELQMGRGQVEISLAGSVEWRPAEPLLALRAGDAIRATEDAWAVVVLSGGKGSVRVNSAGSPFVVPAVPAEKSKVAKAAALLQASFKFLSETARDTLRAVLVTRGDPSVPVVLTPRNTAVLPGSLTFEWVGSHLARYSIKIVGPSGVVLERTDLAGSKFDYPGDAPTLLSGVRYRVQVVSERYPTQEAWFEVLDSNRAQTIQQDLKELEQALGPLVSANSLAVIKVGLLAGQGLFHDARLSLIAAATSDPDEATFHVLLGDLYAQTGLPEVAAGHYAEARFLLTRGRTNPPEGWR
jgi:hypothetical protein